MKQYRIQAASAAELVRNIEAGVAAGALSPGQQLPSVRRLAVQVGLSPVTVSSALAELRRRGVVLSEQRRGTRFGQGPPIGFSRPAMPVPAGARDLSRGNPDPALLPDLHRALACLELPVRLYGEPAAVAELTMLAREQLRDDGVPCDSLCVVSGALDGIERVLEAHLRPGDRVAVENPGYAALFDLLRARGWSLQAVAVDERGMRPQELRQALARGARAAIITPRGQNPTGAALDARRARELRGVLAEVPQALVIEDDHLGPIASARMHTTVTGREHWACTRSVAKALGPDLRLALLAGDPQTVARVQGRQQCGPGWVSHILQLLVLSLWRDAAVQELIARASSTYAQRRESFLRCLRDRGVEGIGASGLNVWVAVDDETGVVGALLQRGWVLAPGAPYRLPGSSPAIRVTIATLLPHEAESLAAELADVLAPARSSRSG
ncbi:MAG: aminotransferase class I/II-fold pyridoxal phosphate-dependent enzyme [Actinomycetota bacterium]|nr:aminotransferase class I/II-fold pyridoxal phosphate-dependent enzyme [Actinomycetota bacterium]